MVMRITPNVNFSYQNHSYLLTLARSFLDAANGRIRPLPNTLHDGGLPVTVRQHCNPLDSGGCVLNKPENIWPALRGATMNRKPLPEKHPWGFAGCRRPVFRALIKP
jgi:hypothetical protein